MYVSFCQKGQISKDLNRKYQGSRAGKRGKATVELEPKYISPPFSHHVWILPNQVAAPFWWIFYDQILTSSIKNVSTLFLKSVAKLSGYAAKMPWKCCSLPT